MGFARILARCGQISGRFGKQVWRGIGEAFPVEDLALMIRATRGRSRRPNHMHSHLDALQGMGPIDLRRGPGAFHSVAKQASFCVALWSDFSRFWSDFERFWEANMEAKIDFLEVTF